MLMKVVLIGSGNVSTVLGKLMLAKGHEILQVISRNEVHADVLAQKLGANADSDLKKINLSADICVVAIADDALITINKSLRLHDLLVVHTAGSVSREVLHKTSKRYGVLYPLQSLRAGTAHFPEIPLLVDGNNDETTRDIYSFAATLSDKVSMATDEHRLKLHLAAVASSNFINHLLTLTEAYCIKEGVEFKLLFPLLSETVNRIQEISPSAVQTGPAIRNDQETIMKHLGMLSDYPELQKIYNIMTKGIQDHYPHS
jgi:predicted short-subunit dehydrogenase-like oxidoreductase (DUF2520 family)